MYQLEGRETVVFKEGSHGRDTCAAFGVLAVLNTLTWVVGTWVRLLYKNYLQLYVCDLLIFQHVF